ncbi:MAG: aldolase/citrate lyase family protein [Rhodospirillaceae bacterium]
MKLVVRRSNLVVPIDDAARVAEAWQHDADAITLDMIDRSRTSAGVREALRAAARGGAEVFVKVGVADYASDLQMAVGPGLRGVMLAGVQGRTDVAAVCDALSRMEDALAIERHSTQLIVALETARAVWEVRDLVRASPRVLQVFLDEAALAADLRITPHPEYDPFVYARGRVVTEAIAADVSPVGMSYPLSAVPAERAAADIHAAALVAKNTGMKGVVCPFASWVAPVNRAFTPTPELVEWNRRVRAAFAAGVAAGTAAVPLDGKMIDVPVDEWAIVVLAMADACAARDAEKKAAMAKARGAAES